MCERLFVLLMERVEKKSSPGYPYVWQGVGNNESVLQDPALFAQARHRFLELMEDLRQGKPLRDPTVRIFVKPEPHKIQKIIEGRLRLIWALPLEYQLVHRLFLDSSLTSEIANFREIPSKGGMSNVRGGFHRLFKDLDDGTDGICDKDMKGWDMSASQHTILMERDVRWRLCVNPNDVFKRGFDACYDSLLKSRVIFSDGTILEQLEAGIVRSGSMITLSGNSRMQVINKVYFCLVRFGLYENQQHKVASIGDDTLERLREKFKLDYMRFLSSIGYTCKEAEFGRLEDRTFCSHKFFKHKSGVYVPVPLNWNKHAFALTCKESSKTAFYPDQLLSLMLEYAFVDDKFQELRDCLVRIRPELALSQELMQNFMLGLETSGATPAVYAKLEQIDLQRWKKRLECVEENPGPLFDGFWQQRVLGLFILSAWLSSHAFFYVTDAPMWMLLTYAVFIAVRPCHASVCCEVARDSVQIELSFSNTTSFGQDVQNKFVQPVANALGWTTKKLVYAIDNLEVNPFKHRLRETRSLTARRAIEMPKKNQSKSVQKLASTVKKMMHQKEKRVVKQEMKLAAAMSASARARPRKTRNGGNRLAFLQANKFNMERAQFGGRDLVAKIVLSAASADSTSGADVAGTNLFQTQIRPQVFIPNTRLGQLMNLFMKWRLLKARFTFKSSLPPGTNAGTMLFVHEPDPNEEIPAQYAAPTAGTLSNYDSHSIKALVPMAKAPDDFKGEFSDHLDLKPSSAVGPGGGWFVVDPNNMATAIENSMGQFAIFVQDAHNILGANADLPTQQYEIGSLFFEYDIEVQTAADNGSALSGGYTALNVAQAATTSYVAPGNETSMTLVAGNFVPPNNTPGGTAATAWAAISSGTGLEYGVKVKVLWDGTHEWWSFSSAGVYLVVYNQVAIGTGADLGTSYSGWGGWTHASVAGSQGSVLHEHSTVVNSTSYISASGGGPVAVGVLNVEDPLLDFFSPGIWHVGTTGSSTVTTTASSELRFIALPPETTYSMRKELRMKKAEEKTITDMTPQLEKLFAKWMAQQGCDAMRTLVPADIAVPPDKDAILSVKREERKAELLTPRDSWFIPKTRSLKN